MAYTKTQWKDRVVERPRTFQVQNNPDGTITLIPAEGIIVEAGTPITAGVMNKIENQLYKLSLLKANEIENTTQYPTYTGDDITKIEHKRADNSIARTDNFTYTPELITETRILDTGETLTLKYYFDENGNYVKTEVI